MVGFAHAAMALGGSFSLALLHLRHMNPYVVTSMKVTGERLIAAWQSSRWGCWLVLTAHAAALQTCVQSSDDVPTPRPALTAQARRSPSGRCRVRRRPCHSTAPLGSCFA